MRFDAEAGRQPQNGPGVLGDIGLKQRNTQGWGHACTRSGRLVLSAALAARIVVATEGNPTGQARSAVTGFGARSGRRLAQKPAGSKRVMRLLVIAVQARAFPTCAPLARVPIKRRWIKPLGLSPAT
jgi:hypothetical protein